MQNFTLRSFIILSSVFFSVQINAQSFAGFSEVSVILKSDSSSKSVLVSNMFENQSGDQSPFIGTAVWLDSGKKMQCRSFISFNYNLMPSVITPAQITSAYLILNPLQLGNDATTNENQSPKFIVRRVVEPWKDSMTTWTNQPLFATIDQVTKQVTPKKKDRTVKIDVTRIVRNMFELGNYGFMISYKDSMEITPYLSQWFASARNENADIRPLLVINYEVEYRRNYDKFPDLPLTTRDRAEIMENYIRPEPVVVSPPAEPVKVPVKD